MAVRVCRDCSEEAVSSDGKCLRHQVGGLVLPPPEKRVVFTEVAVRGWLTSNVDHWLRLGEEAALEGRTDLWATAILYVDMYQSVHWALFGEPAPVGGK